MMMTKAHKGFEVNTLHLAILFATFGFVLNQRLSNPCRHNQFHCSDSGLCLNTEALCNGRRECQNGEDERGGGGWRCGAITLVKNNCNSISEFRCRFGSCIPRQRLCDGNVDCWGGGDEAIDVCTGDKVKIVTPSSQFQTVFQTTRPPLTRQPPTRQTTTRPIIIAPDSIFQTTTRTNFPTSNKGFGACGSIRDDPALGYKVTCENSRFYEVKCEDAPEGATAQYTCRKLFTPTSSLILSTTRKCENGRWSQLNYKFGCEAECGVSTSESGAFIVGGSVAKAGRWPWMVAIYERNSRNSKMEFICGGSLISSKAVITAAHCIVKRDTGQTKSFNDLKIVVGKYYRTYGKSSDGEQERGLASAYVHPEYNRVTLNNDIAILKLSTPVQISDVVRPICLPSSRDYTETNQLGTLVGWGRGNGKVFQEQLQQAELPVVLNQRCTDAHPQFATLVHQGTFCAGYTNGTSACDGDSGGPLVFRDRLSPSKWLLHGIVSAGIASADGRAGCNPNFYTVFTDVGFHSIRRWISSVIDTNFQS